MKKLMSLLGVVLLGLVGCTPSAWKKAELRIGMITDSGSIDDKSFNQGTWEGIEAFAEKKGEGVAAKYLKPAEVSDASYQEAIDSIVKDGANVVVTPGFLFESAVYYAQTKYPNVKFILIDGEPHTPDYATYKTESNTLNILFKEEQSGFLAGYASVKDGYNNLGFVGGMAVPAVIRFGEGYVAGAYTAAKEDSKTLAFPGTRYVYSGTFSQTPEEKTRAASWYSSGTDLIFAAAGSVNLNVFDAVAEAAANKRAIGVDVDQGNISPKIITSAEKKLANAVDIALQAILDNKWDTEASGQTWNLGVNDNAVGLPSGEHFRFTTFTAAQYEAVYGKLKSGAIVVPSDVTGSDGLKAYLDNLGVVYDESILAQIKPETN